MSTTPAGPRRVAFADETFRDPNPSLRQGGYYQLTAVLLEASDAVTVRHDVSGHADRDGEFKASTLANRGDLPVVEAMIQTIVDSPCFNLVVFRYGHATTQEAARQQCLEHLLLECDTQKVNHLVLDSRESVVGPDPQVRNKLDLSTYRRLIRARRIDRNLRVTHRHDSDESLLWVPDAVGWTHRRHLLLGDSALWNQVSGLVTVTDLSSS